MNRSVVIYNVCFLALFDIVGIACFTDGAPTTGMFIIFSFIVAAGNSALYIFIKHITKNTAYFHSAFANALLLYLISELVFVCLGEPALFGVIYLFAVKTSPYTDIMHFRQVRDIAYSASCLLAGVVTWIFGDIKANAFGKA